jgi:hypothetical protein
VRLGRFPSLLHRLTVSADGQLTADMGQRWHMAFTYSLLY